MKKIVLLLIIILPLTTTFVQAFPMVDVKELVEKRGLKEYQSDPVSTQEAINIYKWISFLVPYCFTTDFKKLDGYSLDEGVPCTVVIPPICSISDDKYKEIFSRFCVEDKLSEKDCQQTIIDMLKNKRKVCRIYSKCTIHNDFIEIKDIEHPTAQVLERLTENIPLSYANGIWKLPRPIGTSSYTFPEPSESPVFTYKENKKQDTSKSIKECTDPIGNDLCILYIENTSDKDKTVREFFQEASSKTKRQVDLISLENARNAYKIVHPGEKAEIKIPPSR